MRILQWVAVPFSRGSSRPRDQIQVSCIAGRFFTIRALREAIIWLGVCREAERSFHVLSLVPAELRPPTDSPHKVHFSFIYPQ